MIEFRHVTVTYPDATRPVLRDVDLRIPEGELCLVVGRTGSGKSTFLGTINGLVPHFTGGTLAGQVVVDGKDTARHPPRELADTVGVVMQDPLAGFVTDTVEEELAYGLEQLAVEPGVMRKRVEETLDLLGLAELRHEALRELSGGQQQRVAIGAVLTTHPRVLVLDEPTSALDPTAAEEVLAAITRLVHDVAVTVIVAEHRLERVVQYADRIISIAGDGTVTHGLPAAMLATTPVAPPVIELGRLAGWDPLPLSIRDARRAAEPLRVRLASAGRPSVAGLSPASSGPSPASSGPSPASSGLASSPLRGPGVLTARRILVSYGDVLAVRGVDLDLAPGQVTALMGRNGSGKSSLLWALQGSGHRQRGVVDVAGRDPKNLPPAEARTLVGLVPQSPSDLLYLSSVDEELAQADHDAASTGRSARAVLTARELLDSFRPGIPGDRHPRDLSEGQRLLLVLSIQLRAAPAVALLDEPTRGLDYASKHALRRTVAALAASGHSVVISTHDVEFVALVADRVVVMAEGEIVADGPCRDVIAASPAFAPQVAKIMSPLGYLTVEEVAIDIHEIDACGVLPTGSPR